MSSVWPKVIRDPVHNIIPFEDTRCDQLLLRLINTREFQRLRRIKQLGFSQLVFPGADHSRFAHSIGVMQIARRFLERIAQIADDPLEDDQRTVVLAAALLHDIGHGPFSHAFEKVTEEEHEERTLQIISDPSTDVHKMLKSYSSDLPGRLKIFFDEDLDESEREEADIPAYLTQVVTSQLDADRFDYLLRDSLSTGADYGRFDIDWLLLHLHVDSEKGRFYLDHKATFAAETYVFARYHMYRSVYFHKTTRAAEIMLQILFQRYRVLLADSTDEASKKEISPGAPPVCQRAFAGSISLPEFLELDDHAMTEFCKSCTHSNDDTLRSLAEGLLHRKLFKVTDASDLSGHGTAAYCAKAEEIIVEAGMQVEYSFKHDAPSDTAYKLYNPDAEVPATQIYIEGLDGIQMELSRKTESVHHLTKKYKLLRYYFPDEVKDRIRSEAEPLLRED